MPQQDASAYSSQTISDSTGTFSLVIVMLESKVTFTDTVAETLLQLTKSTALVPNSLPPLILADPKLNIQGKRMAELLGGDHITLTVPHMGKLWSVVHSARLADWTLIIELGKSIPSIFPAKLMHGLSKLEANVPLWLGRLAYVPEATSSVPIGEAFAPSEEQNWPAVCADGYGVVVSRGLLDLASEPTRQRDLTVCVDNPGGTKKNWTLSSACIYSVLGIECRSITGILAAGHVPPDPVKKDEGWGNAWRQTQWNCTVPLPTGDATAVCQAPLRTAEPTWLSERESAAPDSTGDLYREVTAPLAANGTLAAPKDLYDGWIAGKDHTQQIGGPPAGWHLSPPGTLKDAVFVVGAGKSVNRRPVELFVRSLRATG